MYCKLDQYIEQRISFAIFKYPNQEEFTLMIGTETQGSSYDLLNDQELFIIAPFDILKHPMVAIIPEKIITSPKEISEYTQPLNCDEKQQNKCDKSVIREDRVKYHQTYNLFSQALLSGEYSKLVLSRTAEYYPKQEMSVAELFLKATENIDAFVYLCYTPSVGVWLGITPELLLKGKGVSWETMALAGTRNGESLSDWDSKNIKEQLYVKNYICDILSKLKCNYHTQEPKTIKAGIVEHLKTSILFDLPEWSQKSIRELIGALHPTPAVCGLLKDDAQRFISLHEGYDREYYSGFIGYYNPQKETQIYVNLRCMKKCDSHFLLFAGGGLLPSSIEEKEWNETQSKMQTILSLFN